MGKPQPTKAAKKKPGDFKRPKRKVGRKAPPAANVTSVAISSRRINMLEQSVLQDKGDAVTHRHLSLQDLMQQLGHYNAHMRQRALQGLRELAQTHTSNVLANVAIVLERFLRTFVDEEAIVREAALGAWRVLLPVLLEGKSLRPFARLITMYFCSGLTHLQVGIRQDTLKAISVALETAPALLRVDAGHEQLGRLLENFRDLVAAAPSQGIKVTNTYDLLTAGGSSSSSKKGNSSEGGGARKKSGASKGALQLRFSALTVLHRLLESVDVRAGDEDEELAAKTSHKVVRNAQRMGTLTQSPVLLLYPPPALVTGAHTEGTRNAGFWQEKSRTLLKPLLDLWLECLEADNVETLSEEYVENMQRIVECATVILAVNVEYMANHPEGDLVRLAKKVQEQLMSRFPMFPAHNLAASGDAWLSRWYGLNVAMAKFACVLLKLPPQARTAGTKDVEGRVETFLMDTLSKYAQSDELRALSGTHAIVRALLEVVALVLASTDAPAKREDMLAGFTAFYVKCSPRGVTFRICTSFVIDRLSNLRLWPSWELTTQWLTCFGNFLGQLDSSHIDLGRQCLFTTISIMKQLPAELATGEALERVLSSLERFFNLTTEKSEAETAFRFDDLSSADQLEFVSLVYHLPHYPVALLRALASCCKSPRVQLDAKSFLMDILHQRSEQLDLAHLVSFLMSGVLARPVATAASRSEHLQLVHHVARILLSMNLGASLAKILTPALSRQAATVEATDGSGIHTLMVLYGACFASVRPIHRGELPMEMLNDVVTVGLSALRYYGAQSNSQNQETEMLCDLLATIALSEDATSRIVTELMGATTNADGPSLNQFKALQFVLRSVQLRPWVLNHRSDLSQRLESSTSANAMSEDVTRTIRQIRGDLDLLAAGQQ